MNEFFARKNRITKLEPLSMLLSLELLDLSDNKVQNFQEIIHIAEL